MTQEESKARIMIVEDEVIIAEEIRMTLEELGYEVTSISSSGEVAVERAKTERPDLVLMDILLKGDMDGIETAGIIRDSLDISVIYLTASAEQQKLERAKKTRPAGYILKPFSEQDIRIALEIGLFVTEAVRKNDEHRKRLAAAERIAGFGSCQTDIKTGRCTWSDELFHICGYEPGAIEPDADMGVRIIHPDDRDRVADLMALTIESGHEYDVEKRIVRPDGTIRYVHSLGSVIRDAAGRPVKFIKTFHDITAKKRFEDQDRLNRLRLEIVNEIALLPDADEKKICDLLLDRMLEISDSRIGYLGFMTEDEQVMLIHAWSPSAMADCHITDKPIEFSIAASGLWGEPVRHRGPIVVNDYDAPHEVKRGCPAGHVRIERFMSVPVFDGGRIVALVGVGNKEYAYTDDDVTQLGLLMQGAWEQVRRKRVDKVIAESEKKYRSLIANIPDVTWTSDADGNKTFISDTIASVYGYTAETVCAAGRDLWFGRIHADDRAKVKTAFDELFEKKADFDVEYRIQREDGAWIWLHDRAISVYEEDGVNYADGIFSDVTERRHMENELRFQSQILGKIQDFVTVTDLDGNIVYVNDAVVREMKRDRTDLLGASVVSYGEDPSRGASQKEIIKKTLNQGQWRGEVVNRRPDGSEIILDCRTSLIKDKNEKPVDLIGVGTDITERKKTEAALRKSEEQLRQSQRMESIGTLAGGIAHDFNNILYPIIGHSEMLIEDLAGDNHLQERVRSIMNSALRAADLVKQILSFSRQSQQGKTPVKIQDTIHEVLMLIRHSIPAYINIVLKIDNSCSPVLADPGQIHQVIMNLITNASHAMADAAGTLEIGLCETRIGPDGLPAPHLMPGRYIDLYVADTGAGMEAEVIDRIFDPFFSTKEVGKGTGLGLSVSYGIVKQHDGVIRVESRPGQGATFHVYLPASTDTSGYDQPVPVSLPEKGKDEHLLFVDDMAPILELGKSTLTRRGYRVTPCTGSVDALETFRKDPDQFDLLITDMNMPDMTGVQLAGEIRKIRPDLPIILCTGFSEQVDEEKALALGINAFLMKPVGREQLAAAVRQVLDERAGK